MHILLVAKSRTTGAAGLSGPLMNWRNHRNAMRPACTASRTLRRQVFRTAASAVPTLPTGYTQRDDAGFSALKKLEMPQDNSCIHLHLFAVMALRRSRAFNPFLQVAGTIGLTT